MIIKSPFSEMVSRGKKHLTGVFGTVHLQVIETTCTIRGKEQRWWIERRWYLLWEFSGISWKLRSCSLKVGFPLTDQLLCTMDAFCHLDIFHWTCDNLQCISDAPFNVKMIDAFWYSFYPALYLYGVEWWTNSSKKHSFEDKSMPDPLKCMQEDMPVYSTNAFQSTVFINFIN